MKKLFTLGFVLLLLNVKSYSQTQQFPFYGLELSNYEVGDTLEYEYGSFTNSYLCNEDRFYIIINKQVLSSADTIKYTIRNILSSECNHDSASYMLTKDTIVSLINKDSVYNCSNNLINYFMFPFDTVGMGSLDLDSAYIKYDTIRGLKRLRLEYYNRSGFNSNYTAIQNLGITEIQYVDESGIGDYNLTLSYAHLAHYGIYGTYTEIFDGEEPTILKSNSFIYYNNADNSFLLLSSSQNLPSAILTIYDLPGRTLITTQVNIGSNPINLNNFAKGMYLYKVTSNGNVLGQGKLMNF